MIFRRPAQNLLRRARASIALVPLAAPLVLTPIQAARSSYAWVTFSTSTSHRRLQPTVFPTEGFEIILDDQPIEEEETRAHITFYYPVRQGEVFDGRYQVITKLGFGACSTIWLAKDLEDGQYVTLKVYIHNSVFQRELPFYARLSETLENRRSADHPGTAHVRQLLHSFEVQGPNGMHPVLVHPPCHMSLYIFDGMFMEFKGFEEGFVKLGIIQLLHAVDFLHTVVGVVHTDIHMGNLLIGELNASAFGSMEQNELTNPTERKILADRTIYRSRLMVPTPGPLLLCDFGESHLGLGPHQEQATMPAAYKPPEVLLGMEWGHPVDVWMVGLTAWSLLGDSPLFKGDDENGEHCPAVHLAEIIAALGPPPAKVLARSPQAAQYWDEKREWKGEVKIQTDKTLELGASKLNFEDTDRFLAFMRKALTWDPEERPSAKELLEDPWLKE